MLARWLGVQLLVAVVLQVPLQTCARLRLRVSQTGACLLMAACDDSYEVNNNNNNKHTAIAVASAAALTRDLHMPPRDRCPLRIS